MVTPQHETTTIDEKTKVPLFTFVVATIAIIGGVISFVVFAMKVDSRLEGVEKSVARIEAAVSNNVPWSSFDNWIEDYRERNPTHFVPRARK